MKLTHTPGPWRSGWAPGGVAMEIRSHKFSDNTSILVAALYDSNDRDENARLIDAAPEILESLEALLDITPFAKDSMSAKIHERERAAIHKARGE